MRKPTREQVDAYRRDGFVLVEGFLEDAEPARWRDTVDRAVAGRLTRTRVDGDEYYRRVFTQLQRLADTHAGVAGLVAHAAGANMTPEPRRAMPCAFMPSGSTCDGTQNILPDEYVERLEMGDVLDDDAINPLVWSS